MQQIKKALGIAAVYTEASGWCYTPKKGETGAQIDLLLDRADHSINVCEMKFANGEFAIDKKYAGELDTKVKIFKEQTKTKKTIFPTMITTHHPEDVPYFPRKDDSLTNNEEI